MVSIQSTIGDAYFTGTGSKRNFIVEDESQRLPPGQKILSPNQIAPEQQINPAIAAGLRRQAMEKQEQAEQIALNEAKHRIEIITGIGRKTKEIEVDNVVFTLKSLKEHEQQAYAQVIEKQERQITADGKVTFTQTGMHAIKVEALSHSLYRIDHQPIDVILGVVYSTYPEQLQARRNLVLEMDGALTDFLFVNFDKLTAETADGYVPKTTEEVKEVVEATRKSSSNT